MDPPDDAQAWSAAPAHRRRRLVIDHASPGPTLVVTAGIHGNEPAGLIALSRIHDQLAASHLRLRGRLVAVVGNQQALARGIRYLDRDLNRGWEPGPIDALLRDGPAAAAEDLEQHAIAEAILDEESRARGPLIVVDLHTTSAASQPFVCMADTLRNRPLAFALGLPVVLGLEEVIDGSMLGWVVDRGHSGIAIEGGEHSAAEAVAIHEAALWIALHESGCLRVPDEQRLPALARLERAAAGLPRVLEIRHRHVVAPDDEFRMAPGFASFTAVQRGQLLAQDRSGGIHSTENALLLMPRYQPQGEDGFFLAREVRRAWLRLSASLRWARADRLLPWLPGVDRDTTHPDQLVVARPLPGRLTTNLMHLFGYRRVRARDRVAVYSRRRPEARSHTV
jgi:succinylglutamate desuccinylase